jgi:uncharacterized membrane protein
MISLKNVLYINGTSSGITAAGLITFPKKIADIFEVQQVSVFTGVGIFLFAFAAVVLFEASRINTRPKQVQLIIALDILWVVASLVTVLMTLTAVSMIGHFLILTIAIWVGAMAYLQKKGLKQFTI